MLKGESSENPIKNVKARVAEIQQTLPPKLEIDPFLDRAKLLEKAVYMVVKNLIEGGAICLSTSRYARSPASKARCSGP